MPDAATAVRVAAVTEPGSHTAEANAAVRPVSMPVVDRGVGTAVTPIRPDHREVLQVYEPPARLARLPDPRNRGTVTGDPHLGRGVAQHLSAQFVKLTARLRFAYHVVRLGPARRARKTLEAVS